jgi:DNA-binding response OmpR family regulator
VEEPRTIVVIEDEEDIRILVDEILRSGGYRVFSTSDPKQAANLVREKSPDLVLCDIAMPEMDGYGVLRALQADPNTARYPVVFLTANREFTERVRAFRFGVVDYLTKPFTHSALLAHIGRVLDSLDRRSGVAEEHGDGARALIEDVHREARTGLLSVTGGGVEARTVLQAGEVVAGDPLPDAPDNTAEFRELDPTREEIVVLDPERLPEDARALPKLDLPDVLKTVLIVDDNAFFRVFLGEVLRAQGFTVYEAESGDEGLRLALARRPWLILTDLNMPGLDGFELCRSVRSHTLIRHTPLIFLSGWDDYQERVRGLEAGADEYLSKQTPVRELLIRIQLILKRYANVGVVTQGRPGMEGRLEVIGPSGLLQVCHLGRLSGVCFVRSGSLALEVRFRAGEIVGAERQGLKGEAAIFDFLSWTQGHFEFVTADPGRGAPLSESFEQLLLEGCHLLDEKRRAGPQ